MMNPTNMVQLIGRLGKDPETRHLDSGATVCNFTMATSKKYKDKNGEQQEITQWHSITAWNKLAEIIDKYVSKGDEILIIGELTHRSYDDADGNKKYITEVVADQMRMFSKKSSTQQSEPAGNPTRVEQQARQNATSSQSAQVQEPTNMEIDEEDDLPF